MRLGENRREPPRALLLLRRPPRLASSRRARAAGCGNLAEPMCSWRVKRLLLLFVSSPAGACSPPAAVSTKERSLLSLRHTSTQPRLMRLPPGSRALRRRSSLPHSVPRRAPRDGTVGLRNPVSRVPVRERGDKVFGERHHATTGFFSITDSDDFFPDVDVDVLFGNMSSSANANGSSSTGPYVTLFCLFEILFQTLFLAVCVLSVRLHD